MAFLPELIFLSCVTWVRFHKTFFAVNDANFDAAAAEILRDIYYAKIRGKP